MLRLHGNGVVFPILRISQQQEIDALLFLLELVATTVITAIATGSVLICLPPA
jgi:hypothetical protein